MSISALNNDAAMHLLLERLLGQARGGPLFNPYRDRCPIHDHADAPALRRANLHAYLHAQLQRGPAVLWLAEAPGATGLRRTGLPLIPEPRLADASQWLGLTRPFIKATHTASTSSHTASAVWEEIDCAESLPLLWNVLMHHPHPAGRALSNRAPRAIEQRHFQALLATLATSFRLRRVIAIGRVAERAGLALGLPCHYVRHPAQGGLKRFRRQMRALASD